MKNRNIAAEMSTFANTSVYSVEKLTAVTSCIGQQAIPRVTVAAADYEQALDDINSSLNVYEDKESGQSFEIAVANADSDEETVDAELSTFTSSISGNMGNAIEFAEHSALFGNRRRLYIASFGNGGTSYWTEKERKHIRKTGRFTQNDGSQLPTVAALARVLDRHDAFAVSRLSTNSAGGAYATALMGALPEGQITHAYMKSRPNISSHPTKLLWGASFMLKEQAVSRKHTDSSDDPWKMTDDIKDTARLKLADIYEGGSGAWSAAGAVHASGVTKLLTDTLAFSRGGLRNDYPAVHDTAAALRKQYDAKVTYHFPSHDSLYGQDIRADVFGFLSELAVRTRYEEYSQVEALIMPGSHHDHSAYPAVRWSMENYAFNR
jgi:hypothetical protein